MAQTKDAHHEEHTASHTRGTGQAAGAHPAPPAYHHLPPQTPAPRNTRGIVLGVILGLLLVMATVQAFTLAGVKAKLQGASLNGATASVNPLSGSSAPSGGAASGGAAGGTLQQNIQNLPQMVGGC
ncbi:hypothetical protein COY28_01890 [Candidatus Woesearchaeota archaeon CG_4_10_14_0_2_um_filter_57_5]|nr:MAG: hypothetical protein AUJ68_04805 [Candidatus Woesearchaeota archaeon CG1_02_57_44]PIZ55526.1 MAG: hypothetical protein COY28_01890 [Candidatus Woesearchaeota archaeon CG_4_10_14_0_2_um_filter_57_5]